MRSGNPALSAKTFQGYSRTADAMTVSGTVNKTFALLIILMAAAMYTWNQFYTSYELPQMWLIGPAIGGLVVALIIIFKKTTAPFLAPSTRSTVLPCRYSYGPPNPRCWAWRANANA